MRRVLYRVPLFRRMRFFRRRGMLLRDVDRALARGAAAAAGREVDPADPLSWEFSGFSQNGEDGILDVLTRRVQDPTRFFVEVGAGDGRENTTSWLAVVRRYGGVMVDADPLLADTGARLMKRLTPYVEFRCARSTPEDVAGLFWTDTPDVFAVDTDGGERALVAAALAAGKRPAIIVAEIDFREGASSLDPWRAQLEPAGYRFVTVESNGVNAFFADTGRFDDGFLASVAGVTHRDNVVQRRKLTRPRP